MEFIQTLNFFFQRKISAEITRSQAPSGNAHWEALPLPEPSEAAPLDVGSQAGA